MEPPRPFNYAGLTPMAAVSTPADRAADLDLNDYSRRMFQVPFAEANAAQKSEVAAAMRADQRCASGGVVPTDCEAAAATRLATRALRAAERTSGRGCDDYALALYGMVFQALTPAQMEDVSSYMRNDEQRAFGHIIPHGEAAEAKRQADLAYAAAAGAAPAGGVESMDYTGPSGAPSSGPDYYYFPATGGVGPGYTQPLG